MLDATGHTFGFEMKSASDGRPERDLLFRITFERKHARMSTGVRLLEEDFLGGDQDEPIRLPDRKDPRYRKIKDTNGALRRLRAKAATIAHAADRAGEKLSARELLDRVLDKEVKPSVAGDFITFGFTYIKRLRAADVRTISRYEAYVRRLSEWRNGQPLTFAELNAKGSLTLIRQFETWLQEQPGRAVGSTMGGNTVAKAFGFYKSVAKAAVQEELLEHVRNPFAKVDTSYTPPSIEHLTGAEVEVFRSVELANPRLRLARDLWMFQLYCAGRRVGDVLALRWRDLDAGGRWRKAAQKTDKQFTIQLIPDALAIAERYRGAGSSPDDFVFPMLDSERVYGDEEGRVFKKAIESATTMLNSRLQKIAADAGIGKHLTTHLARHTFSHLAMEANTPITELRDALEHSSVAITEGYSGRFASDAADKVIARVFGQ